MKTTKYASALALGLIALTAPRAVRADSTSVYVVTAAGDFGTINLTTGAYSPVATGDGAVNYNGDLYSINLANGATTLIGNTGINVQQGMFGSVCENTGLSGSATTLYYTVAVQPGCITTNQQLYSIDPTTAAATLIGQNFGLNNPVIGSAYDNGTSMASPKVHQRFCRSTRRLETPRFRQTRAN